jgi:hypothetical protein
MLAGNTCAGNVARHTWGMRIDYNDRLFRAIANSGSGDVDDRTLFSYRQYGDVVWATYHGGAIAFGTMVGVVRHDGTLDLRYQHVSTAGAIKRGRCVSTPEVIAGDRVRLHEAWEWTEGGHGSGTSIVEQVTTAYLTAT